MEFNGEWNVEIDGEIYSHTSKDLFVATEVSLILAEEDQPSRLVLIGNIDWRLYSGFPLIIPIDNFGWLLEEFGLIYRSRQELVELMQQLCFSGPTEEQLVLTSRRRVAWFGDSPQGRMEAMRSARQSYAALDRSMYLSRNDLQASVRQAVVGAIFRQASSASMNDRLLPSDREDMEEMFRPSIS